MTMQISDETIEKLAEYMHDFFAYDRYHDSPIKPKYVSATKRVIETLLQSGEVVLRSQVDELVKEALERIEGIEGICRCRICCDTTTQSQKSQVLFDIVSLSQPLCHKLRNFLDISPFKTKEVK